MALLQEIKVPLLSVNDTSLTVIEISFNNGSAIKTGDIIMVFETSKTTYDVVAEFNGFIEYKCASGEDYEVNEIVANIYDTPVAKTDFISPTLNGTVLKDAIAEVDETLWDGETLFSYEAKQLIEAKGYDQAVFKNLHFVSKDDVEARFGLQTKQKQKSSITQNYSQSIITEESDKIRFQKLSSNKKREIEYLTAVQSAGLISTINIAVDTGGIFGQISHSLKYLKNSLLPIIIYECSRLLKKYPLLNAFFNGENIAVYNFVNVGFAIDVERGLKVLKINDANVKNIIEIEQEIMDLSSLYLEDRLSTEHLTDITFTVTDLSSEKVLSFTPLINLQNSAILGISAIDEKFDRCTLSLTFDHRVTEGKAVAVFLRELKERIEAYQLLKSKKDLNQIKCFKCQKTLSEDLSGVGFAKCLNTQGNEGYICQSCFKGF